MRNSLHILTIGLLGFFQVVIAQNIQFIQTGNTQGDSSYYDIFQKNSNEFWIGGKGGILKKFTLDETNVQDIPYPNEGASILRINQMGSKMLLAADKGTLYIGENQQWTIHKFKSYRNHCFYDLLVIDSLHAFMCGGKSKIAVGKRTIPFGFILATRDGGVTWDPVFKDWKRMVWRLEWDAIHNKVLALTYSPTGSLIFESLNRGEQWSKTIYKSADLFHDFSYQNDKGLLLAGGESGNLSKRKSCLLQENRNSDQQSHLQEDFTIEAGLIWDYSNSTTVEAAGACFGNLLYRTTDGDNTWKCVQVSKFINLYEVLFYSDKEALIIGSNKSLLSVQFDSENHLGLNPPRNKQDHTESN